MLEDPGDWLVAFRDQLSGFVPQGPTLRERANRLAALVDAVPSSDLSRLDVGIRAWSSWDDSTWRALRLLDVELLSSRTGDPLTTGAVLSMHPNGYVREAAITLLDAIEDGREARWLLLRTLDWVPQIADLALAAVERHFAQNTLDADASVALVRCLPLLESERFSYRDTAAEAKSHLESLLSRPEMHPALIDAAGSSDRRIRRAAVRLLLRTEDPLEVLRSQMHDPDVVAVGLAAQAALSSETTRVEVSRLLLVDGPPRYRAEAVWTLAKAGELSNQQLERALTDPSATVRDVAQRTAPGSALEPASWYRARLPEDPLGSLLGTGDVGNSDDVEAASHYVFDPSAPIRAAAVRVVARHGASTDRPLLDEVITSGTGRAVREAIRGIGRLGVSENLVRSMWQRCATEDVGCGRLFHSVLPRTSRWTMLRDSLLAVAQSSPDLVELGYESLGRTLENWNRSATPARQAEAEAVRLAYAGADGRLRREQPSLAREVAGLVKQVS